MQAVAHFVLLENESDYGHWELCTMIKDYSQALDTLWLKTPFSSLTIKNLPRACAVELALRRPSVSGRLTTEVWGSTTRFVR